MTDEETIALGWRPCNWIRRPLFVSFGRGCVTEAAFLWKPQYAASFLFGWLFRGAGLTIPREEIEVAERATFGLNKNILSIRNKAGERYRFQVDHVDAWLRALGTAEEGAPDERNDA